jgi:hypothetical protein
MRNIILSIIFCVLNTSYINPYQTSKYIVTPFTSRSEIEGFMCSSNFYNKYLKLVNAENIEIEYPSYDNYDIIRIPQKLSYYSKPNLPYLSNFFPKIKIEQYWYKNNNDYFGDIKTKYIEFRLIVKPIKEYDQYNYTLQIEGTILKKNKKIIPNKCLDYILKDFCEIFIKINTNYLIS